MEATNNREWVVNAATSAPTPTLTVAAVARRLGVAPPTLRTWDRRYGLGPSAHTAGAHRRYSPADVARLMVMRRLTLEGVSPADAAKIALATAVSDEGRPMHTPADGYDLSEAGSVNIGGQDFPLVADQDFDAEPAASSDRARPGWSQTAAEPNRSQQSEPGTTGRSVDPAEQGETGEQAEQRNSAEPGAPVDADLELDSDLRLDLDESEPAVPDEARPELSTAGDPSRSPDPMDDWSGVLRSVPSERSTPGGGRVVAMPDGTPQSRGLARAAMSLDTFETNRMLTDMIRRDGVVSTWNSMIMPVLRALGERTRVTGDGIDVEHAFSEVILGVMRSVAIGVPQSGKSPVVLLACADSDYHSLPLHALAAALAERGVGTRMLGSGLPPHALSASVRRTGPSVIVLFARMSGADAGDVEALRRQRPAPTVILAGPGWRSETVPSSVRTASSLTGAVDEVLQAIHV
jgi:DNA-binding transcriptional MerR regulator